MFSVRMTRDKSWTDSEKPHLHQALQVHSSIQKLLLRNSLDPFYKLCVSEQISVGLFGCSFIHSSEQLLCAEHCLGAQGWTSGGSGQHPIPLCALTIAAISEPHFFPFPSIQFQVPPKRRTPAHLSKTKENSAVIFLLLLSNPQVLSVLGKGGDLWGLLFSIYLEYKE